MRLEARRAKDIEEAEMLAKIRELDLKKLQQSQSRGGANDGFGYSQRLKKGDFTFDTQGKAMLVKKKNPNNLPEITQEPGVKIKYARLPGSQSGQSGPTPPRQSDVRVRPVTLGANASKAKNKKRAAQAPVTELQVVNQEQKEQVALIETELEAELERSQIALEARGLEELSGGLYADLQDIASHVTYKKEDGKVLAGPKPVSPNRMTLPEYEVMSNATRSIGHRPLGSEVQSQQLPDFHGMQEIAEREDASNQESSVELASQLHLQVPKKPPPQKPAARDSPERIIRGEGANEHLPGMVDSQTIPVPDSGLGLNKLQDHINDNDRYIIKNTRLWSAVNPAQGGVSRLG